MFYSIHEGSVNYYILYCTIILSFLFMLHTMSGSKQAYALFSCGRVVVLQAFENLSNACFSPFSSKGFRSGIHFPAEFRSNPNQTHLSMLINVFRIIRKSQVLSGLELNSIGCIGPPGKDLRNPDLDVDWCSFIC